MPNITLILSVPDNKPYTNYLNQVDYDILPAVGREDVLTFFLKGQVGTPKSVSDITIEKLNEGK